MVAAAKGILKMMKQESVNTVVIASERNIAGECGADNDIAARICHECDATLVDPDKKAQRGIESKRRADL